MVRKYVRKTHRAAWNHESLLNALNAIKNGKMSKLKASVTFGVPRRTLQHRLKKANFMKPYKASNTYLSADDSADDIEWIECTQCHTWFHETCVDAVGNLYFTCSTCL